MHIARLRQQSHLFFDKIPSDGNIPGMNKALKQILTHVAHGVSQAMVISHDRTYVLPAEKSFPLDAASLRRDADKIAHGLSMQFRK